MAFLDIRLKTIPVFGNDTPFVCNEGKKDEKKKKKNSEAIMK